VLANGILSPGASVESLAVGATTFSSGSSIFAYEVDSSVVVGSGSAADLLVSNGNLSIGTGSILEFTDLAATPAAFSQGTKFSLISYGSNSWSGGLFTHQGNELSNLETFSTGLNQWEIRYNDPVGGSNFTIDQLSGSSVTITAVPEPASLGRVGPGAFAPRPLTEPDLWVPHPALWVPFSQVKQERLTRGQFRDRVQFLPRRCQ